MASGESIEDQLKRHALEHQKRLAELQLKTAEAKLERAEYQRDEAAAQADVARMLREHVAANIDRLELPKIGGGRGGGSA